ncbi:hypothetical protein Golob_013499, partial [Gossypium lobatum]|nr:hypothetical protein [Gossypium lobatum]
MAVMLLATITVHLFRGWISIMENEMADLSMDDREEEAMKSTMENVWHPIRGVQISDLRDKRFLFKFFYRMDLEPVINGAHWTFNNHLMMFHRLEKGEDPVK